MCQGKQINKYKNQPTQKYSGLKNSFMFLLYNPMKNIVPNGTTKPGIPFAKTAKEEKI